MKVMVNVAGAHAVRPYRITAAQVAGRGAQRAPHASERSQ